MYVNMGLRRKYGDIIILKEKMRVRERWRGVEVRKGI